MIVLKRNNRNKLALNQLQPENAHINNILLRTNTQLKKLWKYQWRIKQHTTHLDALSAKKKATF